MSDRYDRGRYSRDYERYDDESGDRHARRPDYGSGRRRYGRDVAGTGLERAPGADRADYGERDASEYSTRVPDRGGWSEYGRDPSRGSYGGYGRGRESEYDRERYGRGGAYDEPDAGYRRSYPRGWEREGGPGGRDDERRRDERGGGGERGWAERAADEVASWFGDDDAERRRRRDQAAAERGAHRGRGPRGYRRSDERIRDDVNDRLTDHPYLDASDIEVRVENAEVTLTGTVESRNAKRLAEDVAESVFGVTDVFNQLRVARPGGAHDRSGLGPEGQAETPDRARGTGS